VSKEHLKRYSTVQGKRYYQKSSWTYELTKKTPKYKHDANNKSSGQLQP